MKTIFKTKLPAIKASNLAANRNVFRLNKQDFLFSKFRVSGGRYLTSKHVNGSFAVKSGGLMVTMFIRMLSPIGLGTTRFRAITVYNFIKECFSIYSTQGMRGLVIWLKAMTVLLQQALSGYVLKDTSLVGCRVSRTGSGLCRVINRQDRALIRKGGVNLMRFYLTLFNLYRVLSFPGKLKLHTITDGFKGNGSRKDLYLRLFRHMPTFVNLIRDHAGDELISGAKLSFSIIPKSSPGTQMDLIATSPLVLFMDARNLMEQGLDTCVIYFAKLFEKGSTVKYPGFIHIFSKCATIAINVPSRLQSTYNVGRLGFKDEAAGKVRVFAMVDAWTNWVLRPLHDEIFRILKTIPMDGTFDQTRPVREYQKWKSAYSLDLTAATDRIPISVQIGLLGAFYGMEFALNWSKLLVGRGYTAFHKTYVPVAQTLRYGVGQPMGALSSWAMLALVHHFIVQCAA
jgi:hypothetical protein